MIRKKPILYVILNWNSNEDWFDLSYVTGITMNEVSEKYKVYKSHIYDFTKLMKMFEYMKRDSDNQFYGTVKLDVLGWVDKTDGKWYPYRSLNQINDDIRKYKDIYKHDKCKRVLFKEV